MHRKSFSDTSVLSDIQPQGPYWTTTLEQDQKNSMAPPHADYKQKRLSALKAMHSKTIEGIRSPTNVWAGYGVSQTSPITPTNTNAPVSYLIFFCNI